MDSLPVMPVFVCSVCKCKYCTVKKIFTTVFSKRVKKQPFLFSFSFHGARSDAHHDSRGCIHKHFESTLMELLTQPKTSQQESLSSDCSGFPKQRLYWRRNNSFQIERNSSLLFFRKNRKLTPYLTKRKETNTELPVISRPN